MGIDAAQKRDDDAASDSCSGTLPPARSSAGRSPSLGCCCRWKRWGNRAAQNQKGSQVGVGSQVVVSVIQLRCTKKVIVHGNSTQIVDVYVICIFCASLHRIKAPNLTGAACDERSLAAITTAIGSEAPSAEPPLRNPMPASGLPRRFFHSEGGNEHRLKTRRNATTRKGG